MVSVEYEAVYAADVAFVLETLTAKDFLDAYATEIGALTWSTTIDGRKTRLQMNVPTTGVPAAFKRFVTPTVDILEARNWDVIGGRCTATATVDAAVGKREAHVSGTIELVPVDGGCRFRFTGDIAVNLRVVGDAAAVLIRDLIRRVLGKQSKVMQRWIEGAG